MVKKPRSNATAYRTAQRKQAGDLQSAATKTPTVSVDVKQNALRDASDPEPYQCSTDGCNTVADILLASVTDGGVVAICSICYEDQKARREAA